MFKKFASRAAAGSLALVAAGSALATEPAAGVDVSTLETTISDAMTPIGTVGLAVLAVLAGIMVFKLIRRVM